MKPLTPDEAHELLKVVRAETEYTLNQISGLERMLTEGQGNKLALELSIEQSLDLWIKKMLDLGVEPIKNWRVRFKVGDGYLIWTHPNETFNPGQSG